MTVLLLLHAFPLDARMWEGQIPPLEQAGHEVIAPNLPGSEPDPSLSSWAARILELLPGDFIPVGISMGGYLAFELWRQAPKRIPALVLADTRANADDEGGRAARDETIRVLREEGFDAFWDGLAPKLFSAGASAEVVERARTIASEQSIESLVATVGLVTVFTVGIVATARRPQQDAVSGGTNPGAATGAPASGRPTALVRSGGYLCFALCAAAVAYGIYLIVTGQA